jgi:PAS domain S-box-containing protein
LDFEYRYQHPELGLRWFHCKGRRLTEDSTLFAIVQDITDRQKFEEALRATEERFRTIVETTPECVKVVAADGTLLHMNTAGLKMMGAGRPELVVGKSVYDLIVAEDRDRFRIFNEMICRGEKFTLQFEMVGLDGIRHHMETHAAPLHNADGSIAQLAVTRDITQRKQVEDARGRLAAIVESSDDAIVSKNLDGIITSWNASAERLFGYTAAEAIGQHITLIIPPERRSEEDMIIDRIRHGYRVDHFETVRVRKDGTRVELSLTISPVKDESGRIVGASKVARDITERRQAERALLDSQERLRKAEKLAPPGNWRHLLPTRSTTLCRRLRMRCIC